MYDKAIQNLIFFASNSAILFSYITTLCFTITFCLFATLYTASLSGSHGFGYFLCGQTISSGFVSFSFLIVLLTVSSFIIISLRLSCFTFQGFSEFSGLRNSSALPFGKKSSSDEFVSFVSFQTSAVSSFFCLLLSNASVLYLMVQSCKKLSCV